MAKVLIVEPKPADARALKTALRDAGLVVAPTVLKNGAAAKRHLSEGERNCIVLINVHSGDSMEFLDWLSRQGFCKNILVIAVGERTHLRGVVEACERGANTFVIKPVHREDLRNLARTYPDHWPPGPE